MGAQNANRAFQNWATLPHREMRALVFMAVNSMDDASPPVYFGGWEALAVALGADPFGKTESARQTARRAIEALVNAGAVVSSGQARKGVRAEYALVLDPGTVFRPCGKGRDLRWEEVAEEPDRGTARAPLVGTATAPLVGTATAPLVGTARAPLPGTATGPPKNNLRTTTKQLERTTLSSDASLRAENPAVDNQEKPSPEDERRRQLAALKELIDKEHPA